MLYILYYLTFTTTLLDTVIFQFIYEETEALKIK